MDILNISCHRVQKAWIGVTLGYFFVAPVPAHGSTGLAQLGQMMFGLLFVLPAITLGVCLICLIVARARSQPVAFNCAIALGILTLVLGALNFGVLQLSPWLFLVLPFLPLFLAATLLLSQLRGPIRVAAGYFLIAVIGFFFSYMP